MFRDLREIGDAEWDRAERFHPGHDGAVGLGHVIQVAGEAEGVGVTLV